MYIPSLTVFYWISSISFLFCWRGQCSRQSSHIVAKCKPNAILQGSGCKFAEPDVPLNTWKGCRYKWFVCACVCVCCQINQAQMVSTGLCLQRASHSFRASVTWPVCFRRMPLTGKFKQDGCVFTNISILCSLLVFILLNKEFIWPRQRPQAKFSKAMGQSLLCTAFLKIAFWTILYSILRAFSHCMWKQTKEERLFRCWKPDWAHLSRTQTAQTEKYTRTIELQGEQD